MARAQDVELALAQPLERTEIACEGAGVGGDEHAALAEHGVAREAHATEEQGEVVGGVAGGVERLERAEALAVAQLDVGATRARPPGEPGSARAGAPTASAWSMWSWVSAMPPRPPRSRTARRESLLVLGERRARVDDPRRIAPDYPTCSCQTS